MDQIEVLKEAIEKRKPIQFSYNLPGKTPGLRIGNLYAIFVMTKKSGIRDIKLHLVQTEGVSDTKETNPLPDFRLFNLSGVNDIEILEENEDFEISEDYNPGWEGYNNSIKLL